MALLQDLIQQIDDSALRERILQETNKLLKQKKFGLVFEEHLPECTPLYDVPIRVGSKVAVKTGYVSDIYIVIKIDGEEVLCDRRETHEQKTFQLDELVTVAEFGEPIYPTLKPIDTVENAPDSGLWHALIEADNYHALAAAGISLCGNRWTASTSIRRTIPVRKTGNTITTMLTALTLIVTANGFP
jgi:adenine-specific DNA-methyltransferase